MNYAQAQLHFYKNSIAYTTGGSHFDEFFNGSLLEFSHVWILFNFHFDELKDMIILYRVKYHLFWLRSLLKLTEYLFCILYLEYCFSMQCALLSNSLSAERCHHSPMILPFLSNRRPRYRIRMERYIKVSIF